MSKDYKKLQSFVEAALTNPRHPVYKMGLQHSPILQHYAVNVSLLQSIPAAQWFADYPDKTARLEEVMAILEAEQKIENAMTDTVEQLRIELRNLKTEFDELRKSKMPPDEHGELDDVSDETPEV